MGSTTGFSESADATTTQEKQGPLQKIMTEFSRLGSELLKIFGFGSSTSSSSSSSSAGSTSSGLIPDGTADAKQNWAYFSQSDTRWGDKPYSEKNYSSSGCAPTSMAMITTGLLGNKYFPTDFGDNYGSQLTDSWSGYKTVAPNFGLTVASELSPSDDDLLEAYKSAINLNHPVIFTGSTSNEDLNTSPFTTAGHHVVSQGYLEADDGLAVIVNDPGHSNGSKPYKWDTFKPNVNHMWSFAKDSTKGIRSVSHTLDPFPIVDTIKGDWPSAETTESVSGGPAEYLKRIGVVTSPWGPRVLDGVSGFHEGIDYGGSDGDTIYSPISGEVAYINNNSDGTGHGYGNFIQIRDDSNQRMYHWFCHMQNASALSEGQKVNKGDPIGIVGHTGSCYSSNGGTGAHLHYSISSDGGNDGIFYSNRPELFIDPATYVYTPSTSGSFGTGKDKFSGLKTISNSIYGLGKKHKKLKDLINFDYTATDKSVELKDLNYDTKREVKSYVNNQKNSGGVGGGTPIKSIKSSNKHGTGDTAVDTNSQLLQVIIGLLQQIVSNSAQLTNLSTIVDLLSQGFDIATKSAGQTDEEVSKLNKIKQQLKQIQGRQATQNQGSSNGFGTSLMGQDTSYIMTAMSGIVTD
jgi:murein DD-endopeptidase MepM/ murein hydrolase activator NlpD